MKVLSESESCPSRPRFAVWCHMFPNQIVPSHFCNKNCPRFSLKTMSVLSDKRAFSCRGTMCRALKEMENRYISFLFTWRTEFIKQVFPMFRRPLAPPEIRNGYHMFRENLWILAEICLRLSLPVVSLAGLSSLSIPFVWRKSVEASSKHDFAAVVYSFQIWPEISLTIAFWMLQLVFN